MFNVADLTKNRMGALGFALLAIVSIFPATVFAQAWPAKPIRLVVPLAPGGPSDLLARTMAQQLTPALGQPIVVDNRPGAGTTLGADIVAKAKPDGYTLLMGAVHHTIAPSIYKRLPYLYAHISLWARSEEHTSELQSH